MLEGGSSAVPDASPGISVRRRAPFNLAGQ
jgi:hypothetical protein